MVLILNMMLFDLLKKMEWEIKGFIFVFVGIIFYKYWKKKIKSKEKN